jgi:hypothetical protein
LTAFAIPAHDDNKEPALAERARVLFCDPIAFGSEKACSAAKWNPAIMVLFD